MDRGTEMARTGKETKVGPGFDEDIPGERRNPIPERIPSVHIHHIYPRLFFGEIIRD